MVVLFLLFSNTQFLHKKEYNQMNSKLCECGKTKFEINQTTHAHTQQSLYVLWEQNKNVGFFPHKNIFLS